MTTFLMGWSKDFLLFQINTKMNSYRLSLGGGQQAANRTSEPFYAVWNLESHPGTILG